MHDQPGAPPPTTGPPTTRRGPATPVTHTRPATTGHRYQRTGHTAAGPENTPKNPTTPTNPARDRETSRAQANSWTWPVTVGVVALVGMSFVFVCTLIALGVAAGQAGAVCVGVVAAVVACVIPGRGGGGSLARRVMRALLAGADEGEGK